MSVTIEDAAHELGDEIRRHEFIEVICHSDADGIAAGAIMGTALYRAGIRFRIRAKSRMHIDDLPESSTLLCDLGSGISDLPDSVMVIDHHHPLFEGPFHVNPRLHNINGDTELSGAGAAYLVANTLGDNRDLCGLVMVGILGDGQEIAGKNKEICQDAIATGIIDHAYGLRLGGRTLDEKVLWSTKPYFSGYSGDNENVMSLFAKSKKRLGTGGVEDENPDIKLVSSLLVVYAVPYAGYDQMCSLYGDTYTLNRERVTDAHTMNILLDSCAKSGASGKALAVAMRAPLSLDATFDTAHNYRMKIIAEMNALHMKCSKNEADESLRVFEIEKGSLVSDIADAIWHSYPRVCPVAVRGVTSDNQARVSFRGSGAVNIGACASELAKKHHGVGGGHLSRAGATVPIHEIDGFLADMREAVR
ncbi:MAG: phosphoesterase [Methanomicrobiales archaeon]|jgi:single-stranded DNA-specific DHH superfamily exonuclease|nr:phosphoesterase [Methanomicrobiales archaeon]